MQVWEDERTEGRENSRRFAVCWECNSPLVFSKETAGKKINVVFNYCGIMKELLFVCFVFLMWPNRWEEGSLVWLEVV